MLAYIKGILEIKMTGYIIVDVGGLGYKIYMSDINIDNVGNIGENIKVHTFYKVKEDDISIFGFNTLEELKMFELLISVSGVGAKTALAMLAVVAPSDFALAVVSEDVAALTQIPGIGPKSAKRIILELKDKIKKEEQIQELSSINTGAKNKLNKVIEDNKKILEAIEALKVLGYSKKQIEKEFEKIEDKNKLTTEELIKKGLNLLGM